MNNTRRHNKLCASYYPFRMCPYSYRQREQPRNQTLSLRYFIQCEQPNSLVRHKSQSFRRRRETLMALAAVPDVDNDPINSFDISLAPYIEILDSRQHGISTLYARCSSQFACSHFTRMQLSCVTQFGLDAPPHLTSPVDRATHNSTLV